MKNSYTNLEMPRFIQILTLISLGLAYRLIHIQQGWITDDFVLYHEVSRLFSIGDIKAGLQLYNWPLYPALIAIIHKLTTLSLTASAQTLTVALYGLTTYALLSFIKRIGGDKKTILFGALLFFSTLYVTGDVVSMLVRDTGFWAFYLLSLNAFHQYLLTPTLSNGMRWQVLMIMATLFRIEGVLFLMLLPFMLFFEKQVPLKKQASLFLKANSMSFFALLIIIVVMVLVPSIKMSDFGRLQEVTTLFDTGYLHMMTTFSSRAALMSSVVFENQFDDVTYASFFITLTGLVVLKVLNATGWIAVLFAVIKDKKASLKIEKNAQKLMLWAFVISMIGLLLIILNVMLISKRYAIPAAFIILVYASFNLSGLVAGANKKSKPMTQFFLILMAIICGLCILKNIWPKKESIRYEQHAVNWAKQHTVNPNKIFYVSPRARYYASAPYQGRGYDLWDFTKTAILNRSILDYETLVITLDAHQDVKAKEDWLSDQLPEYSLAHIEYGHKNKNRVLIFKKTSVDASPK
jgi:hypothetical protein